MLYKFKFLIILGIFNYTYGSNIDSVPNLKFNFSFGLGAGCFQNNQNVTMKQINLLGSMSLHQQELQLELAKINYNKQYNQNGISSYSKTNFLKYTLLYFYLFKLTKNSFFKVGISYNYLDGKTIWEINENGSLKAGHYAIKFDRVDSRIGFKITPCKKININFDLNIPFYLSKHSKGFYSSDYLNVPYLLNIKFVAI